MLLRSLLTVMSLLRFTPVLPADIYDPVFSSSTNTQSHWVLVSVFGETLPPIADQQQEIYLTFDYNTMRFEGFAGCNNIVGSFETAGPTYFEFTTVATTKCTCSCEGEEKVMLEGIIAEALVRVDNYSETDTHLTFLVGDVEVLKFEKRKPSLLHLFSDVHRM